MQLLVCSEEREAALELQVPAGQTDTRLAAGEELGMRKTVPAWLVSKGWSHGWKTGAVFSGPAEPSEWHHIYHGRDDSSHHLFTSFDPCVPRGGLVGVTVTLLTLILCGFHYLSKYWPGMDASA
jgi:hypothetical protein